MNKDNGGINYQDQPHHEGAQNNTVPTGNNRQTSHRDMKEKDSVQDGTERDTANQLKQEREEGE